MTATAAAAVSASSCSVCMAEDIHLPCTVKECGHVFCSPCIHSWCQRQLRCPLCNCTIQTLITADGTEEVVQQPAAPNNEAPDLDCLDHQYMLGDIHRVLSRARAFHDSLMRDSLGRGGGVGRDKRLPEATMVAVHAVINRLVQFKLLMDNEVRYDVHQVLNDMYCLNDTLSDLQSSFRRGIAPPSLPAILADSSAQAAAAHSNGAAAADSEQAGHQALDAYDDDVDEEDDEHECYYDDHGVNSGRGGARGFKATPGRRPAPRSRARGAAKR